MGRIVAWPLVVASALVPALAVAGFSLVLVAGRVTLDGPWQPEALTLSEAAATGSLPEIERLVGLGANPNEPSHVRRGLISDRIEGPMTPLRAAETSGRQDVIDLLQSLGATHAAEVPGHE